MLVKTFEAACKKKALDSQIIIQYLSAYPEEHRGALISMAKTFIVVDVLNDGWRPNWSDYNEAKYELYWDLSGGGFRLNFVRSRYSGSNVGSRLVFKTKTIGEHAAKYFENLFKDWVTFQS